MKKNIVLTTLCMGLLGIIIIVIGVIILIYNPKYNLNTQDNNTNKPIDNNSNENNDIIFKDLSFIKNVNSSSIANSIYNQKYIIDNKIIYDLDGNILFNGSEYDSVRNKSNYFIVKKDNKKGVVNEKFEFIVPLKYYDIEIQSDKCLFLEELINDSTIITTIYNTVTSKEHGPFSSAYYYNDNFVVTTKSGSNDIYFLDIQNDKIIKDENNDNYLWTIGDKFQEDYIILSKLTDFGLKKGVVNSKGQEIIPFIYDDITNIENKFLLAKTDNLYTLLDISNKTILKEKDIINISVYNDIIEVEKTNENYDYYYNENIIYSADTYSTMSYIGDKKYLLEGNNKCNYIDLNEGVTIKEVERSFCNGLFNTSESGYIIKETDSKESLYSNNLEQIFKNEYDSIDLYQNFCLVEENNSYKIKSYNEELLLEKAFINYQSISEDEILLIDQKYNKYYFRYNKKL